MALNPPSIDIKDLIDADSDLGLTFATDLFISERPTTPDACVCIYDTPSGAPDAHLDYHRPGVQVLIRGARGGYEAAHEQAQDILNLLNGYTGTVNSARYIGIWAETDVIAIGQDDNRRPLLSVNFRIHRATA